MNLIRIIGISALVSMLSACVITPAYYHTSEPIVYPMYENAYVWDDGLGLFFFIDVYGRRRYMDRGWYYRH